MLGTKTTFRNYSIKLICIRERIAFKIIILYLN